MPDFAPFLDRRLLLISAFTATMTAGHACSAQVPSAAMSDLTRFQGTWVCTRTLKDGEPVQTYVGVRAIFKGDRLTWIFRGKDGRDVLRECGFSIDPNQNPKQLDWHYAESADRIHRRIYRFDGDVLWMADNMNGTGHPPGFGGAAWQFECKRVSR